MRAAADSTPGWDAEGVRGLRAHLALSQTELAARLGTRQQTISEWETGARAPRPMSRRLLHLLAESEGFYRTRRDLAGGSDDEAAGTGSVDGVVA